MTRAQALVDAQRALKASFPDRWVAILAALEKRVMPSLDAPTCPSPKCGAPVGTPVAKADHGFRREGNLLCVACGEVWTGTPAEVAQALASWKAYDDAQAESDVPAREEANRLVEKIRTAVALARCSGCGSEATCIGTITQSFEWHFQCNACCDHGGLEVGDFYCVKLTAADPRQGALFGGTRS